MKPTLILSCVFLLVLIACNSKNGETVESFTEEESTVNEPLTCYHHGDKGNRVLLKFSIADNMVEGEMMYALEGKDINKGTFKGTLNNGIILADYTFMSEGVISERQIAFQRTSDGWLKGFGPVVSQGNKVAFTDAEKIDFRSGLKFVEEPCDEPSYACIGSYTGVWSALKGSCVELSEEATELNPIEVQDQNNPPAYLIFADDQSSAEVYLPGREDHMLLQREGEEGNWVWKYEDYELITWKGYVLRKEGVALYGGV
ncbi:hypothetical protein [Pararhodonellum marinum]|uniref:hypothetical protein n=1 Tax=Pararhodonellum marinum TaxID=2755358 RepID=UPI00188FECB6|nr:hypothetical protein [Pararhodonellum marinum]